MTINIVPVSGTVPRTGKFGVVASHPGTVTLTASDPRCVLTPSSFDVGGAQTVECAMALSVGMERQSVEFQQSEFTLGFESKYTSYTAIYGSYYNFMGIHGGTGGGGGKWKLLNSSAGMRRLMLQYLNTVSGYGYCNWLHVFPLDTVYRAVIKVEALQATLYWLNGTSLASETLVKVASSTSNYGMPVGMRFAAEYNAHQINDFQYRTDFATDAEILAYLLGTGDLGSSLYCKLPMNEESGNIAYDQSGNNRDFTNGGVVLNNYKLIWNGLQRTITTPFTNTEQSISYDMTTIPPGTNVTITASRVKAGFPTGRVPDISVESDTATFTVAPVSVTGITLNKASALLDIGDTTTLTATVWPKG